MAITDTQFLAKLKEVYPQLTPREKLVAELKEAGVTICDEIETYEYGKFVHILDPENNKVELWEPVDEVFQSMYEGKTTK